MGAMRGAQVQTMEREQEPVVGNQHRTQEVQATELELDEPVADAQHEAQVQPELAKKRELEQAEKREPANEKREQQEPEKREQLPAQSRALVLLLVEFERPNLM